MEKSELTNVKLPGYQAVVSDLDGTLLTTEHNIGAYTQKTLTALHALDVLVVIATGRHFLDAQYIRDATTVPAYLISSNGARIHDQNNTLIYRADVATQVVAGILDLLKADDSVTLNLFLEDAWLSSKIDLGVEKFHPISGFTYALFDAFNAPTDNVAKISVYHPCPAYLAEIEKQITANFSLQANIYFSAPTNLEITAKGVSKGAAIQQIAELKNHDIERYMAFGDAMNDLDMLQVVGRGLILQEGQVQLMQCLPDHEVIASCADQGVAQYIEKHFLSSPF